MIFSVSSNMSALSAYAKKMEVAANNVANAETEGFKKSRALLAESSNGDVKVEIERVESPGHIIVETEEGQMREKELSNVDLGEEITEMIPTQRGHEANLTVIRTEDEMLGSILDILT